MMSKAFSIFALVAFSFVQARESNPDRSLEGKWELKNRYCASGAPANDRFVLGRDRLKIEFQKKNSKLVSSHVIGRCWIKYGTVYEAKDGVLTVKATGKVTNSCGGHYELDESRSDFTFGKAGDLEVTSEPFEGPSGTCSGGDRLVSVFRKIQET